MLNIGRIERLARILGTRPNRLEATLDNYQAYYEELILIDPSKPEKRREVLSVTGRLRNFQDLLHNRLLLPRLCFSDCSHGSVKRRNIFTNVQPHSDSSFVMKADISNFFPSIDRCRVNRVFLEKLGCSPVVARACTRLCTYKHKLALGLPTSPILANFMLNNVDSRIEAVCKNQGLVYTRYVDDITISGHYCFEESGIPSIVNELLDKSGFSANTSKWEFGSVQDGIPITGIRIRKNGFDVSRDYVVTLERQITNLRKLANGEKCDEPYVCKSQLHGRIQFVKWINPSRGMRLLRIAQSIDWQKALRYAKKFGIVLAKKKLVPKDCKETIAGTR